MILPDGKGRGGGNRFDAADVSNPIQQLPIKDGHREVSRLTVYIPGVQFEHQSAIRLEARVRVCQIGVAQDQQPGPDDEQDRHANFGNNQDVNRHNEVAISGIASVITWKWLNDKHACSESSSNDGSSSG